MLILGLAGLGLLIVGLVIRNLAPPRRKYFGSWRFADDIATTTGALLLAFYSIAIGDLLFILLNILFAAIGATGIVTRIIDDA